MQPRKYQEEGIRLAATRSCIIADECGLGKTLQAVLAIEQLRRENPIFAAPALVITPKAIRYQWVDMLQEYGVPEGCIGVFEKGDAMTPQFDTYVITHYEAVQYLPKVRWSVVVCDEAHRIKNQNAARRKAVASLQAIRKIALTGTPMEKNPADMWSVLNWMYPLKFPGYWGFRAKYVKEERIHGYMKVIGPNRLDELMRDLDGIWIRRTKENVASQLPPKIISTVRVPLSPAAEKAYRAIIEADDILVDVEDKQLLITNVLARIIRCQQISSLPAILGLSGSSAKLEWLAAYVEDNPDEKIVVFTRFRETASYVQGVYGADIIIGGRQERSESGRMLVGTIAAMGEGFSLGDYDTAIFVDQEWSTIKMNQAIDRIHRINSTTAKKIILLYSTRTDKAVIDALDRKWDVINLVYRWYEDYRNGRL